MQQAKLIPKPFSLTWDGIYYCYKCFSFPTIEINVKLIYHNCYVLAFWFWAGNYQFFTCYDCLFPVDLILVLLVSEAICFFFCFSMKKWAVVQHITKFDAADGSITMFYVAHSFLGSWLNSIKAFRLIHILFWYLCTKLVEHLQNT